MVNPSKRFFADGITEDIITALSRYPSLFVIARSSSFSFKGRAIDVKQVRRELGVRYVIEGSVRKAGNHIRVTAQLDGRGDRNSYSLGDLVLHGEDVDEIPVVVLGPDVATDLGFDGRYESQRGTSMCGPPISAACGISSKLLATTTFSRGSTFSTPFPNFAGVYRGLAMACIQAVTDFRAQTPTEAHSAAESSAGGRSHSIRPMPQPTRPSPQQRCIRAAIMKARWLRPNELWLCVRTWPQPMEHSLRR